MSSRIHRWLFLATGYAWLGQPNQARIRFDAEHCIKVRADVQRASADMKRASTESDPVRRVQIVYGAMTDLFEIIGRSDQDEPSADALSAGIERVSLTLPEGPLRVALQAFQQTPHPTPIATADFRALSELFHWTAELVDTRTPRERRLAPWLRRAGLALAFLSALWLLLGHHNISAGRKVTASSICSHTPAQPYARPRLYRVVDGIPNEPSFAMCTNNQVHPWVQVDLGEERSVSRVLVHGRSDCCWGIDDTPLSVQLSTDGENFRTMAVRSGFIMMDFPWRASFSSTPARYVRLINESSKVKNIVISEIEVYGR